MIWDQNISMVTFPLKSRPKTSILYPRLDVVPWPLGFVAGGFLGKGFLSSGDEDLKEASNQGIITPSLPSFTKAVKTTLTGDFRVTATNVIGCNTGMFYDVVWLWFMVCFVFGDIYMHCLLYVINLLY